jgi:D-tyrosyl-tRNA(Tyr) deacylase
VRVEEGPEAPHEARIGPGVLALVGVERGDVAVQSEWLADRIARMRIFPDEEGKMNRSVVDVGGSALVVSQFTLAGRTRKGTRPSFANAAAPDAAAPLVAMVAERLRSEHGLRVGEGVFGAHMMVESVNDGPVTLILRREPEEG